MTGLRHSGSASETPPATAGKSHASDGERVKRLESVVKRQREVVKEQQASITSLMEHVDELQDSLKAKEIEIVALREQRAEPHADVVDLPATNHAEHSDSAAEKCTESLQQELQRQQQKTQKAQDQLAAAHERERALQLHVAQLQREFRLRSSRVLLSTSRRVRMHTSRT